MKLVKFQHDLVKLVLSGEKTSTWRLFDDKNLSIDDMIELREFGKDTPFGTANIVRVIEKSFKELTDEDKVGHETFADDAEMYRTYSTYYKTEVGPETRLKIIWFELLT